MSNLKVEALAREFCYTGIRIPDPGPDLELPGHSYCSRSDGVSTGNAYEADEMNEEVLAGR